MTDHLGNELLKGFLDLAKSNPSSGELAATMAMIIAVLTPEQQKQLDELQKAIAAEVGAEKEEAA